MTRSGFLALLVAAALSAPTAQAHAEAASGAPAPITAFAATASVDKATFSFPIDTNRLFQWGLAGDPIGSIEYRWSAEADLGGAKYVVGFFLVKRSDQAQSGRLADLLKAGQIGVFREDEGGRIVMVNDIDVKTDIWSSGLVMTISGEQNVDRIFSARPSSLTFQASTPGAAPDIEDVLVSYNY